MVDFVGEKFAFVVPGLLGHLYPCVPLIETLTARGHELHFFQRHSSDHATELLRKYGTVLRASEGNRQVGRGNTDLNSFESRVARFRSMLITNELVLATRDFIRDVGPKAVIGDACLWDTAIAADMLKLPFIGVHTSIGAIAPDRSECERRLITEELKAEYLELFAKYEAEVVDIRRFETVSKFLNIIWTVPEMLIEASDCPANTELVGVSLPKNKRGGQEADWDALSDKPIVYVSFGTIYHARATLLEMILRGLSTLDVNVVVATPALPECFVDALPANCTWLKLSDQIAALEHADAFVSHGGHSSFLEAIRIGVPVLVVPLASDQPNQAFFAEHHGIGRAIHPDVLEPEGVAKTIASMLTDEKLKTTIKRFSELYKEGGGAETAVNRIEERLAQLS